MTTYTTIQDVHREIIEAIEGPGDTPTANAAEFDLDQIARYCWEYDADGQGFRFIADEAEFWAQIERAALTEFTATVEVGADEDDVTVTVRGFNGWEVDTWEADSSETLEDLFAAEGYEVVRVDGQNIILHHGN